MSQGRKIGEGRLRVDAKKAIAKLRQYQLPDPTFWVLEVIRSAVALGATRVTLESDADDLWVFWEGATPDAKTLGRVFDELVSPAGDGRGRRLLAIGINTALSLSPSFVDLYAFSETGAQKVRFTPGEMDRAETSEEGFIAPDAVALERPASAPPAGGAVHTRRPFGLEVLARFFSKERLPELALVRERCRDLPIPLVIEGNLFASKPILRVPIDGIEDAFVELMRLEDSHHGSGSVLVEFAEYGVTMSERHCPLPKASSKATAGHPVPLRVYVNSKSLPTNASRSLLREAESPVAETLSGMREILSTFVSHAAAELKVRPELGPPLVVLLASLAPSDNVRARAHLHRVLHPLFDLPLFRNALGDPMALSDLPADGPFAVVHQGPAPLSRELEPWFRQILWAPVDDPAWAIIGYRTPVDTVQRVEAVQKMLAQEQVFLQRSVVPAKLTRPDALRVEPALSLQSKELGLEGEVALLDVQRAHHERGHVLLHYQGRPMTQIKVESYVPFDAVIRCDALTPTPDFQGVVDDRVLRECLNAVRFAVQRAVRNCQRTTPWERWSRLARAVQAERAQKGYSPRDEDSPTWQVIHDDGPTVSSQKQLRKLIEDLRAQKRPVVVTAYADQKPPRGQPMIVATEEERGYLSLLFDVEESVEYRSPPPVEPTYPPLVDNELRLYFAGAGYRGHVSGEGSLLTRSHHGHVIANSPYEGEFIPARIWIDDERIVPGNLSDVAFAPPNPSLRGLEEEWVQAVVEHLSGQTFPKLEVAPQVDERVLGAAVLRALARSLDGPSRLNEVAKDAWRLPLVARFGSAPVSLHALEGETVFYVRDAPSAAVPGYFPLLCDDETAAAIGALLGTPLRDGLEELERRHRAIARTANRREFLAKPGPKKRTPPAASYALQGSISGTIWFSDNGGEQASVELQWRGRRICHRPSTFGVEGVVEVPEPLIGDDYASIKVTSELIVDKAIEDALPRLAVACAMRPEGRSEQALASLLQWIDHRDGDILFRAELCAAPLFESVAGPWVSLDDAATDRQIRTGRVEGNWIPAPKGKRDKPTILLPEGDRAVALRRRLKALCPSKKATNYSKALGRVQTKRRLLLNQVTMPTVRAETPALKMPLPKPFEGMGEIALLSAPPSRLQVFDNGSLSVDLTPILMPPVHMAIESPGLAREILGSKTNTAGHTVIRTMTVELLKHSVLPAIETLPQRYRSLIRNALVTGALDKEGVAAHADLFPCVDGSWVSLSRLRHQVKLFGHVWAVDRSMLDSAAAASLNDAPLDSRRVVLDLPKADSGPLHKVIPLVSAEEELRLDGIARANQLRSPPDATTLPSQFRYLSSASRGDSKGSVNVGVLAAVEDAGVLAAVEEAGGTVHFFVDGSPIGRMSLPGWPFIALVTDPRLKPDRVWSSPMPDPVRDARLEQVRQLRQELLGELLSAPADALISLPAPMDAEWAGHLHLKSSTTPGTLDTRVGQRHVTLAAKGERGPLPVHGEAIFPIGGMAVEEGAGPMETLLQSGYEELIRGLASDLREGKIAEAQQDAALAHLVLSVVHLDGTSALGDTERLPKLRCFSPRSWTLTELAACWASSTAATPILRALDEEPGPYPALLDDGTLTSAAVQLLLRERLSAPAPKSQGEPVETAAPGVVQETPHAVVEETPHALQPLADDLLKLLLQLDQNIQAVVPGGRDKALFSLLDSPYGLELKTNDTSIAMEAARLSRSADYERALRLLAVHAAEVLARRGFWRTSRVESVTTSLLDTL